MAWTLTLNEREDSRFDFSLFSEGVTYTSQITYFNRDAAIDAATAMRDKITGANLRNTEILDFDPV